jgi:hypothetical protein
MDREEVMIDSVEGDKNRRIMTTLVVVCKTNLCYTRELFIIISGCKRVTKRF